MLSMASLRKPFAEGGAAIRGRSTATFARRCTCSVGTARTEQCLQSTAATSWRHQESEVVLQHRAKAATHRSVFGVYEHAGLRQKLRGPAMAESVHSVLSPGLSI